MKYILFATMISLVSMNTFALGQKSASDNSCCTLCDKKAGGDGSCLNKRKAEKREISSKSTRKGSKKATASGQ